MAKSNLSNINSNAVTKLWYFVTPALRGYSILTLQYLYYQKHLINLFFFKKRQFFYWYIPVKKLSAFVYFYSKIKGLAYFRKTSQKDSLIPKMVFLADNYYTQLDVLKPFVQKDINYKKKLKYIQVVKRKVELSWNIRFFFYLKSFFYMQSFALIS